MFRGHTNASFLYIQNEYINQQQSWGARLESAQDPLNNAEYRHVKSVDSKVLARMNRLAVLELDASSKDSHPAPIFREGLIGIDKTACFLHGAPRLMF